MMSYSPSIVPCSVRVAPSLAKPATACLLALGLITVFSGLGYAQGSVPLATVATDQSSLNLSNQFGVPAGSAINQNGDFAFVGHGGTALFLRPAGASSATRVLQAGDAVPGMPDGRIAGFSATVALNATKVLLFEVRFNIAGDGEFHFALMTYDGANFKILVSSDDPAPGSGGAVYGASLQIGGINDRGDFSFSTLSVTPTGTGTYTDVITYYIVPAGAPTAVRVAGTNDTPPPACTWCAAPPSGAIVYTAPGSNALPINALGQILVSFDGGLFIGSASNPLAVVPLAGSGPCGPSGTLPLGSSLYGVPAGPALYPIPSIRGFLNDAGAVAFEHNVFSSTPQTSAICVAPPGGGPPVAAVTSGSAAPTSIGGSMQSPLALAFNKSGDIAFQTEVSSATGFALLRYRQSNVQIDVIAYWGETAPGTNGLTFSGSSGLGPFLNGVNLSEFSQVSMANTGSVSFGAALSNNQSGLYRQSPGNPPELIFLGQQPPLPFYLHSVHIYDTLPTKILDNGSTFFSTYLTGGPADFAEYLGTPGNLQTLMSTADTLPAGARTFLLGAPPKAAGHYVAFTAEPAGGRQNLLLADISSTPPATTRVVSDNDPALATAGGTPGDTSISSNFFVNDSGQVAFEAAEADFSLPFSILQVGSGPFNTAWADSTFACGSIFLWSPSSGIAKVATAGDTPTGSTAKFPCVALKVGPPSPLNQAGQLAFSSVALGWGSMCGASGCSPPTPDGLDGVYLYGAGGTTSDIASAGDTLPGETQSITFVPFLAVPVNSAGQVAFGARLGPSTQGFFIRAAGGTTENVMMQGDAVPNTTAAFGFAHFISGLTDDGNLAFTAATSTSADGLFFAPAGAAIQTVALDGGPAPGGGTFSLVPQFTSLTGTTVTGAPRSFAAINNESDMAFGASISGGSANSGYFRMMHGGTLQTVVLQGQNEPGGGTFNSIPALDTSRANFALGPDGALAFVNTFTPASGGLDEGLFIARADGTLVRVVALGDTLPSGGTLGGISFGGSAAGAAGEFAFLARIENGNAREGIFVTAMPSGIASATVALSPLSGAVVYPQSVTLTATVSSSASTAPTGTVTFFSNGVSLGPGALNASGQATLTTSRLPAGQDSIVAQYDGDANFASANSSPLPEVVVGFSPPPSSLSVTRGQSLVIPLTLFGSTSPAMTFMLSCSGLPVNTNCAFDKNPVTPSPTGTTVNLTLTTMGGSRLVGPRPRREGPLPLGGFALSAVLAALAACAAIALSRRAPRLRLASGVCLAGIALALVMAGCGAVGSGSNGSPRTPPGPASFTVTGTSGATTISTVVNVTVK